MNSTLEEIADALDSLSKHVLNSWGDDRTLKETFGWNHPAVNRHDLAGVSSSLADRIRRSGLEEISAQLESDLSKVPKALQSLHADTVPYMFNGNGMNAVPAYMMTIEMLNDKLSHLLYWRSITDQKQMPTSLAKRLTSMSARLEELEPQTSELEKQIAVIREANDAAESLPTDLQSLKRARDDVARIGSEASEHLGNLKSRDTESADISTRLKDHEAEATEILTKIEETYRSTTSKGLAASFEQRAQSLSKSVWIWVIGLLAALGIGAWLGAQRVELLTDALKGNNPQWGVIVIHIVLSVVSVGAPLWFAWLATKQIGQRFRLAEDYAFKSSVAKAYEGYRREAARIDPELEARLFGSALTRLEEAPLRLVEEDSHGSPWHELVGSTAFREALNRVPALKDKYLAITTNNFSAIPENTETKED